ncbi:hypothetical protein D3C78_1273120 [compost metagenome]
MYGADQFGHLVQHAVHFRHHIHAIHQHLVADRPAQCGMQHRAALGGVDHVATEHGLDGVVEVGVLGQLHQQVEGVLTDQVLREVEEQAAGAEGKALEAVRVFGEGLAHTEVLQFLAMRGERFPATQVSGIQRGEVVFHVIPAEGCND